MKYFTFILPWIFSQNAIEPQTYSPKHYPKVEQVNPASFRLSDGSEWNISHPLIMQNSAVLIRWDDAKKKYFFQSGSEKIYIEMAKAPEITIQDIQKDQLTLSNGMIFKFLPFKGDVHLNGRVLLSLNENPQGNEYPYFIVEYKENPGSTEEPWEFVGEVQGRLLN